MRIASQDAKYSRAHFPQFNFTVVRGITRQTFSVFTERDGNDIWFVTFEHVPSCRWCQIVNEDLVRCRCGQSLCGLVESNRREPIFRSEKKIFWQFFHGNVTFGRGRVRGSWRVSNRPRASAGRVGQVNGPTTRRAVTSADRSRKVLFWWVLEWSTGRVRAREGQVASQSSASLDSVKIVDRWLKSTSSGLWHRSTLVCGALLSRDFAARFWAIIWTVFPRHLLRP